jgi:DNA-binding beta-propeller fold protein YncE
MAEDAANVANKYIEDANFNSTVEGIDLQPDRTILTQLQQKKTLGILSEKITKTVVTLFKIKGNQSYNVQVKYDIINCYIHSSCCMEDGTIILADYNNNKLKRLQSYNYTVTDDCDLSSEPHQVCKINNTQVAVTVPSKKEVHFISLERQMKTTNKIKTDFECYGLAYANKNLYISNKPSVYMYTLSGRKLKQFSKNQSGHKLFTDIHSLAVSKDATRIYVADYDNGLIVLDNNGQVITSFKDKQFKGAATCCYLTEAGSVLVSGEVSNNVLQFTCDGELIGEVIKADSRKKNIESVCCNQQMTKMYISRKRDDNIEVYDI